MKKLKNFLSFLLCFIIIFSSIPLSVYANSSLNIYGVVVDYMVGNKNILDLSAGSFLTDSTKYYSDLVEYSYVIPIKEEFSKGDIVHVELTTNGAFTQSNFVVTAFQDGEGVLILTPKTDAHLDNGKIICDYKLNRDVDNVTLSFKCDDFVAANNSARISVGLTKIEYSSGTESTGLLNNILEWLRNIRDNIADIPSKLASSFTELGSKITNAFTELGSKITNAFTNLKDQLTEAFKSLGDSLKNLGNKIQDLFDGIKDWFVNLGNRISSFFSELWQNIQNKVSEITSSIQNWWNNVVEFLRNLFVVDNEYISNSLNELKSKLYDSLGFLYESYEFLTRLLNELFYPQTVQNGYIDIPSIILPINGKNIVLLNKTSFNFNELINSHSQLKFIYSSYLNILSLLMYFLVVNFGYSRLRSIIAGKGD